MYLSKKMCEKNITHEAIPENKDLPLQYLDSLDFFFFSLFFFLFTVVATFYAINIEWLKNLDQKEKWERQNPNIKCTIITKLEKKYP